MDKNTKGDLEQQFSEIYQKEYDKLLKRAIGVLRDLGIKTDVEGRAEDAVQEAAAKGWEKLDEMFKYSPEGWLHVAVRKKAKEIAKDDYKWFRKLEKISNVTGFIDGKPVWELKVEVSDLISKEDYHLLSRHYIEKYSYKELCGELNISKPALAMRLKRAKVRFIENFEK